MAPEEPLLKLLNAENGKFNAQHVVVDQGGQ